MKIVIGNFKMNLNNLEINEYLEYFKDKKYSNVYFAPSNIYLKDFINNGFNTIAQDVSSYTSGAYTGDVSANMLKSIGINYSLVGHSERRKYYNDDLFINEKIKRLLEENIIPILCIGENLEERNNNTYLEVIKKEIEEAFKNIDKNKLKSVIIAYEPIWSIGTNKIPSNEEIEEITKFIKEYVFKNYLFNIKVLYGGSVNNNNVDILNKIGIIDGYLVGGCSIKKEEFNDLIRKV